jgi:hypothetical protein
MGIEVSPPGPADPITPAASAVVTGTVTSATAGQIIATTAVLPAGIYAVSLITELNGTIGGGDQDNMELLVGASVVAVLVFGNITSTNFQYPPINVTVPAGGSTISVVAVALATASAVYRAMIVATKVG